MVTSGERPDLEAAAAAGFRQRWPEFVFHDPVPLRHLQRVDGYFAHHDLLLLDGDPVVAGGWGVPFAHDEHLDDLPEGYDAALARAVEDHEASRPATAYCVMAAMYPAVDGRGMATQVLRALMDRARQAWDLSSHPCARPGRPATRR